MPPHGEHLSTTEARRTGPTFRSKTGLLLDAYFSGPKIKWLLDQDDEWRRRAQAGDVCFGTVDSWLVWNLTGRQGPRDRSLPMRPARCSTTSDGQLGRRALPHSGRAHGHTA